MGRRKERVMFEFDIDVCMDFPVPQSPRAAELMRLFGLGRERLAQQRLWHTCRLCLRPGDVVYITGASGAGKSVLLNALYDQAPPAERLRLDAIPLHSDKPAIDCLDQPVFAATETFTRAGLGDVFCMLQPPAAMSLGQQHRYRLAVAAAHPATLLFADEFTSSLDRITAAAVAFQAGRLARKTGKIVIATSSHEDIAADLAPDILIAKHLTGKTETVYRDKRRDPINRTEKPRNSTG